jgi:glutamyl-tRNA reductase
MDFFVFGINHTTAPVEVRERWAFSPEESHQALERIRSRVASSEHVILSTCNRTEFYGHVPRALSPAGQEADPLAQRRAFLRFYVQARQESNGHELPGEDDPAHFYLHRHQAAVEHLFRLAGGLGSMILGESEILRQIKDAFAVARKAQATGRMFQRLFPEALRLGKRVRTLTGIGRGCITPGQAALRLAKEAAGDLHALAGLIIGSGKIATLTARAFLEDGIARFTVINRTRERAGELLRRLYERAGEENGAPAGAVRSWDELSDALRDADIVISSTGSSAPIVSRQLVEAVQARRGERPLVVIDLAVPRDFEASCAGVEGVRLFNIDHLNGVIQENIAHRHMHLAAAEDLVHRETRAFLGRMAFLQIDPVIRHLIERFEEIRLGHLQAAMDRFPPECHADLDDVTRSLVAKLLHFPIERLKSLRDLERLGDQELAFLRRLFLTEPREGT